MALSLQSAILVKQKTFADTKPKPKIGLLMKMFFSYISQHKGNLTLQLVPFAALETTDVVIADVACKVYAIYIQKPSASVVAAFFKGTDALVSSSTAAELVQKVGGNQAELLLYPDGFPMATGFTIVSETTADGAVGSAVADRPDGFVIVGAP